MQEKRDLVGRPVFMAPRDRLEVLLSRVHYPNKVSKALYKLGLDTEDWLLKLRFTGDLWGVPEGTIKTSPFLSWRVTAH